jgi:hypothetical protein
MTSDCEQVHPPNHTTWPVKLLLLVTLFGFMSCVVFTPALDGRSNNLVRISIQATLASIILLRVLFAIKRHEKNRKWYVYLGIGLLAAPLWLAVEALV